MSEKNLNESKMKLVDTTTSLVSSNFTSADICAIIKTCGESGVTYFNFQGLRFSLQDRSAGDKDSLHAPQSPGQVTEIPKVVENSLIRPDEMNTVEDRLAHLKIEDPAAYEDLLAQQELEDEGY